MTSDAAEKAGFLGAVTDALSTGTFVRLTLGKFRGAGEAQKCVVTPVMIKGAPHLRFVTSRPRQDLTENFAPGQAAERLDHMIGTEYLSATLFSTKHDVSLIYSKKLVPRLSTMKPSHKAAAEPAAHDRVKAHAVDPSRPYLKPLGITDQDGRVKPSMYAKFRQISQFIEIVDDLIRGSPLAEAQHISVADIGSGKGYLTFALYDHIANRLGKSCAMTGIEVRPELAAASRKLAHDLGFGGLQFVAEAAAAGTRQADIIIALHACDTATDDAMAEGVLSNAALIVCAPCCQHELAPQLGKGARGLEGVTRFGLFKQRQADLVTDAARALLLEACGYKVKAIEFVSTEHTAKNIMISAARGGAVDRAKARAQYAALKELAGFTHHHLEARLAGRLARDAAPA